MATEKNVGGRPTRAKAASSETVKLRVTPAERRAWEARAARSGWTLSEWIRAHCNGPAIRLTVERDTDGTIAWWAYNALGDALGRADIDLGPNLDRRVFRAAGEHGVDFDEDSVAFEDLT